MKTKTILILIVGILIGAVSTYIFVPKAKTMAQDEEKQLKSSVQTGKGESVQERKIIYWRAPMDPLEIYEEPGKSKMGMDLVPVYEEVGGAGGAGSILIDGSVQQNMNLRLARVERRTISNVIRAYGRVTYAQDKQFSVTTKISGWIEKLYVNTEGQKVRRGEPLLEIYSPELISTQEEYLLALNNFDTLASSPYESIRSSAERMLSLAKDRLEYWDIPKSEIENLNKTGKARRTILLRSLVDGVVTHKGVVEGDRIGPGMDLFQIADLREIWVEAVVYESELPFIKEGQRAELDLDYIQGKTLEGKVDFIYPYLDNMARANNVRLVFNNADFSLKPDMFATVRIFAHVADDALVIPTEAIIHSGARKIVFVTRGDGKFEPTEVKLGAETDDGFRQIISGLFMDDQVVVSGQFLLDSESQLREAIAKMRAAQLKKTQEPSEEEEAEHTPEGEGHETPKMDPEKLYACSMHPEFITSDPDAVCPEDGMKVVSISELENKVDLEKAEFYACLMHPEFLTTDPDALCPECGMKVEKVKK